MAVDLSRLENLFLENDITEVRKLERKTRADIESKKEELRQTVGEKYRGLMDSADVVKKMRNSSQKLTTSVESISRLRSSWDAHISRTLQTVQTAYAPRVAATPSNVLSTVGNVLDITESIWMLISTGEFVQAVRLYTESLNQMANASDSSQSPGSVDHRHMNAIMRYGFPLYSLRESMVHACRASLRTNASLPDRDEVASRCVFALVQLNSCSPMAALQILLDERAASVRETFERSSAGTSRSNDRSNEEVVQVTTSTLLEAIETVLSTVRQILIFSCSVTTESILKSVFEAEHVQFEVPDKSNVLDKLAAFFQSTCETVQRGVTALLTRVDSLTQLVSVRNAVSARLLRDLSSENQSQSQVGLANRTGGQHDVRNEVEHRYGEELTRLIGKLLLARATSALDDAFERATLTLRTELERVMSDSVGLSDSVFADSFINLTISSADDRSSVNLNTGSSASCDTSLSADSDADVASWLVASLDRARFVALQLPVRAVAELNCKSRFYSLSLARFARALDLSVASAIRHVDSWLGDDVSAHDEQESRTIRESAIDSASSSATKRALALSGEPERVILNAHLSTRTSQLVSAALASVSRSVDETTSIYAAARKAGGDSSNLLLATHNRLILLARLCDAIVELCPSLRVAVSQQREETASRIGSAARGLPRTAKRSASLFGTTPAIDDARWIEVKAKVRTQQALIGRFWLRAALEDALSSFSAALNDDTRQRTQSMLIKFESIEVVEESEDGRLLHSAIRVPHAASTYVHELVHALASGWSSALIVALPRTVQLELLTDALRPVANAYRDCFEQVLDSENGGDSRKRCSLLQKQALQFWFDLNYVVNFLPRDVSSIANAGTSLVGSDPNVVNAHVGVRQQLASLVKRVESLIDPIDMYVCATHVQRNLNIHLQRTLLLYAPLLTFSTGAIMSEAAKLNRLAQMGKLGTSGASSKQLDNSSLAFISGNAQQAAATSAPAAAPAHPDTPVPAGTPSSISQFEPIPLLATLLPYTSTASAPSTAKPFTAR